MDDTQQPPPRLRWTAGAAPQPGPGTGDEGARQSARRGNRRRLIVFLGVFLVCLLAGQAWNFMRPLEYRASTRLQVSVPETGAAYAASAARGTHLQWLNSRPLLTQVLAPLRAAGHALPQQEEAAVTALQSLLRMQAVAGSDVVLFEAIGDEPALLAATLNALPEVIRSELAARVSSEADSALAGVRQELERLDKMAAERRARVDRFRSQAGVLAERDDNEAVSRNKGLSTALNNAVEREAAAAARVRALTEAPPGAPGLRTRGDASVAALESRAAQTREEMREMERTYTPDFMAMDPRARALKARLEQLETQIVQQRAQAQQSALQVAQDDLSAARSTVERLRTQLSAARPALSNLSSRQAEARVIEEDLAQVEKARRELLEKASRLEANEQRRVPSVTVLEPATVPTEAFRPDRLQDGLWVLGGSLLLGLLGIGLVEVFNHTPAAPAPAPATTIVVSQPWPPAAGRGDGADAPWLARAAPLQALPDNAPLPLAAPMTLLTQPEAAALIGAAVGPARIGCVLALLGVAPAEALALRTADVDVDNASLRVGGSWPRQVPLPGWFAEAARAEGTPDGPLLHDASGAPLAEADLQGLVACAALDAGLPIGAGLTLDMLRETCIAWLLGNGLRFSDLTARVGAVDVKRVAAFAAAGPRAAAAASPGPMPAVQMPPPG